MRWDAAARAWTALACLICGFALARTLGLTDPTPWLILAALLAIASCFLKGRAYANAVIIAAITLGASWWTLRINTHLASANDQTTELRIVRGTVADEPRLIDPRGPISFGPALRQLFTLRTEGGSVRVRVTGRLESLRIGDTAEVQGRWIPTHGPLNPGEPDARIRAAQDRRLGSIETTPTLVHRIAHTPTTRDRLAHLASRLRARSLAALTPANHESESPSQGLALTRSLLLGEDETALEPARDAFTRVGLSHVLAISGFHLVVLVWSITLALRTLGDRGPLEPLCVASLVVFYLIVVPAEAPILRAGAMAICFLLADALGRRHDRLALLGWIACTLALWRPADAFSLGFQLSVGLTATLLWLGTSTHDRLWGPRLKGTVTTPDPTIPGRLLEGAKSLVSASLLCWLVGLPIIAWHTGNISLLAVPATLIVVPMCIILMWIGFLAIMGGLLSPALGHTLGGIIDTLGAWITDVVIWFDESPFSLVRIAPISIPLAGAAVALALWWCASGRWRSIPHWLATTLVLGWSGMELRATSALAPDVLVRIDTLAVGDGSCHIVRSGRDAMLWDCGSLTRSDIGSRTLPRAARALGITRIPLAVLTHPNIDHANGLVDAARTMGLRTLLIGDATIEHAGASPRGQIARALADLERRGVAIRRINAGDSLTLGHTSIRFIWPENGFTSREPNERSLVAAVHPLHPHAAPPHAPPTPPTPQEAEPPASLLLTGDIQQDAITRIIASNPGLRARVLEMPHHGSAIREAVDLLFHTDPDSIHQSTGQRRSADPRMQHWRGIWLDGGRSWGVTATDGWIWSEALANGTTRSGTNAEAARTRTR
ncbi:MAG: ComEC/Rec2 family competence protein [Phycisphaeraceae bacterium]|nr:ComEC/Rec2 family competence protein [Phycisphaeraceae bacterium]